jgi:hypothetical protein
MTVSEGLADGKRTPSRNTPVSRVLASLAEVNRAHPFSRKLLVAPDNLHGRDLLTSLARETGGWIGWESTTIRQIAKSLAFVRLSEEGNRIGDRIEIAALMNRALQVSVDNGSVSAAFRDLALTPGFRRALRDTLTEVRNAGISVENLRRVVTKESPAHDLPVVLAEYERLLASERVADAAMVISTALEEFDNEYDVVLGCVITLFPVLEGRGLSARLLQRLCESGARTLVADIPRGLNTPAFSLAAEQSAKGTCSALAWAASPDIPGESDLDLIDQTLARTDIFAAVTPSEELREICRRIMGERLRWDDVEIAVPDPDTYGIALDALAQQVGFEVTMRQGIPIARTRSGRALDRWLTWLSEGMPADVMRQAIEAGELAPPGESEATAMEVAREFRSLRIGWGRTRYEAAISRLDSGRVASPRRSDGESDDAYATRCAAQAKARNHLAGLLRTVLAAAPEVPERGSARTVRSSTSAIARSTLAFLELMPARYGGADLSDDLTLGKLRELLERLVDADSPEESIHSAIAALRDAVADVRAWPVAARGGNASRASGGMLHLTDIRHAGASGRPRVFVAGLDASRMSGSRRQDPLLPDAMRRALGTDRIATSGEQSELRTYADATALAGLRGRVTLSYSTSGSLDGREQGPSHLLLQLFRLNAGNQSLSYEDLRSELLPAACAVPGIVTVPDGPLSRLLDARDVWLESLAAGSLLRDASAVIPGAFPMLAAGLSARVAAECDVPGAYQGVIATAARILDPASGDARQLSPSSLEKLAKCPLSWFYHYGLDITLPDDPKYEAGCWLDSAQRGTVLHEVYERFAQSYVDNQQDIRTEEAQARMEAIVAETAGKWKEKVPPAGEVVFEAELEDLQRAGQAFLQMERDELGKSERGTWWRFELGFGRGDDAVELKLPGGRSIATTGKADRVDIMPDDTLRVVDYKTGGASRFARSSKGGPFGGGRQLQPAIYAAAVSSVLGRTVSRVEYRFPTDKGENEIIGYSADELVPAYRIIADLLAHLHSGEFIPTDEGGDCRFCDHALICRAVVDDSKGAPRAQWAKRVGGSLGIYSAMRERRGRSGVAAGDEGEES